MKELSQKQIERQDKVDNDIFHFVQHLCPNDKKIEWNIEMIGDIRDSIESWLVEKMRVCKSEEFYPFLEDSND
jgi:hypothetical protein